MVHGRPPLRPSIPAPGPPSSSTGAEESGAAPGAVGSSDMWLTPVLALSSLLLLLAASASASEIKSDETVVFFRTTATPDEAGTGWNVSIHGWIFEPERDSKWRRTIIQEVQAHLGAKPDTAEGRRCAERASLFLVDNEGRKRLPFGSRARARAGGRVETGTSPGAFGSRPPRWRRTRGAADSRSIRARPEDSGDSQGRSSSCRGWA